MNPSPANSVAPPGSFPPAAPFVASSAGSRCRRAQSASVRSRGPALFLGLVAALGVATSSAAPAAAQLNSKELPDPIKGLALKDRLGEKIPLDLQFTNTAGQRVPLSSFFDSAPANVTPAGSTGSTSRTPAAARDPRPVLLSMVYFRCPMQCPTTLRRLATRLNELDLLVGDKYRVVIISFDPTETPDSARKWETMAHAGFDRPLPDDISKDWAFLSAPSDPISSRTLADALGFPYRYLPESNEYSHPTVIYVLSPEGRLSRSLNGVDFPVGTLRMALLEASEGRIGTFTDRALLWCFHWDPTSGSYQLAAFRVMQVVGLITVVVLGSFLACMWWIDRRRRYGPGTRSGPPSGPSSGPSIPAPPGGRLTAAA